MFHRQNIVMIYDLCDHTWQLVPETWPGYFEVLDDCTVVGTTSVYVFHFFSGRKPVYLLWAFVSTLEQRIPKRTLG